MEFKQRKLANGLRLLAECSGAAYSTAVGFFVETGARDEVGGESGVSHFLEHMAFKGTPTRTAEDVNRELDEIGSHANAYTSEEQTVYFATVLPEYAQAAVELLADMMRPSLREEDFDVEKKVIIEEIYKYEDQPPFGGSEKCMAAHFGEHPLGQSVLGTVESVSALTPDTMRSYFERRYSPDNLILAASGNIDFEELADWAEQYCGHWQPGSAERQQPPPERHGGFHVIEKEHSTQQYIIQLAAGPAAESDDLFAAGLLTTILGDESGSRLYWELVDPGKAEFASMGAYGYEGAGVTMTYLGCVPEQTEENLQVLQQILASASRDGVTDREIEQAKSKICSHLVLRSERPSRRLFALGNNWMARGEYYSVRDLVQRYQAVTSEQIERVLADYRLCETTTVTVGPLKTINR